MKLIKKYVEGETEKIKYHVYDLVADLPFEERYNLLKDCVKDCPNIELVPTYYITSEEELLQFHQQFISEGYEGTMIRHSEEGYQVNKRSSQLLKYKDFLDETYECIDIVPSESRPEQGVVVCKTNAGTTFNCGMKFSHAQRELLLKNKGEYIGQIAEVRFFEYTDSGLPRFPICFGFRLDASPKS